MIDSIDFRVSDDRASIEVGLFDGEECKSVVNLTADEAKKIRVHLSLAIDAVDRHAGRLRE